MSPLKACSGRQQTQQPSCPQEARTLPCASCPAAHPPVHIVHAVKQAFTALACYLEHMRVCRQLWPCDEAHNMSMS